MIPTPAGERIATIDVWRGFALLGVILCNFTLRNREFLSDTRASQLPTADLDWKLDYLVSLLLSNKANTLFAVLFGVGFAIIIERSSRAAADAGRILTRRMLILLLIGWAHFLLLYSGEELHIYALCGLLLLACRGASNNVLVVVGLLLAYFPRLLYEERLFFVSLVGSLQSEAHAGNLLALADPDSRHAFLNDQTAFNFLTLNVALASQSLQDWTANVVHALYFFGRVLLGFALWRAGWILRLAQGSVDYAWKLTVACGSAAVALTLATLDGWSGPQGTASHFVFNAMRQANIIVLAAFYAATLTLLCRGAVTGRLVLPLATMGRMSLSNYLAQSVFMLLLLAGPGLRLAGDIGSSSVIAIALGVYVLQLAISAAWAKRFSYGPAEKFWRYLTYRQ